VLTGPTTGPPQVSHRQVGTCPSCNRHVIYPAWSAQAAAQMTRRGRRAPATRGDEIVINCLDLQLTRRQRRIFVAVVMLITLFFAINFSMNFI